MEGSPNSVNYSENCLNQQMMAHLSDVDDISDVDGEDVVKKLQNTITSNSQPEYSTRRRSIFNTTLDLADLGSVCNATNVGIDAFVERVAREKQNWCNFVTRNIQMLKTSHANGAEAGSYKPSMEQQAYLDQGPDLQNYVRGFGTFMSDACVFMAETEQMQERLEDLKDCCQFHINEMQRNKAAETLAGIKD
ncbi:uncharacterized protein LOC6569254 [Drosophila grimshawi]|uniref:GH17603 n=1 Tax=Drosophila grimshawi TaxID=7222 RepID=B4JXA8_DROGR|nr:uncharacterized protein LOC6569254 [Drosophila grimshawi]EDV95384.1 GH17603 [Drosophila grimshawi]